MTFSQLCLLAVIQGAAELLPVSSSAHVIVAQRLMGLDPASPEMTFLLVNPSPELKEQGRQSSEEE